MPGLTDWFINRAVRLHARRILNQTDADARRSVEVQNVLLRSLIRLNADSDYGKAYGFGAIRNYDDFIKQVPVQQYADLSPWVDRVRDGDVRAMFGGRQRVRMFAMSSGTTDAPKYVPVTDRFLADVQAGWRAFGIKAITDHPASFGKAILQVTSPMDETHAPSGVPCGAITGLMASVQYKQVLKYYAAPLSVAYIADPLARRYTIMRLAIPRDVGWIVTASPATVLQLVKTAETYAESIIRDVRDGTLTPDMDVPSAVRNALRHLLVPNPAAAKQLESIQSRTGALRPKDYWQLGFLANWTGGTMGLYLKEYPAYFGDTPVRDIGLLATEGRMSTPMTDGTASGMAAISQTFLEFIPAGERDSESPTVFRSHELVVGEDYYVLLTTSAGFYRYDICDCVRVTGFNGRVPLIEFLHKGNHVSSMTGEKITEHQVVHAFAAAAADTRVEGADFVLAPRWSDPPRYYLYLDLNEHESNVDLLQLAGRMDDRLSELNIEYESKRSSARLGPIELVLLQQGALARIDAKRAMRFRRANEQFKHQYLYTQPGQDEELTGWARSSPRNILAPELAAESKET